MVRVKEIKDNPRCVASITVRVRGAAQSTMQVGDTGHRILGIFHSPANTVAFNHGHSEDQ